MADIVENINDYHFRVAHGKCPHCGAVGFHTKNIDFFGARTIFDFRGGCEWMQERNNSASCCGKSGLVVDTEAHQHVVGCEKCKEYGY
jgi:hypothetical protein